MHLSLKGMVCHNPGMLKLVLMLMPALACQKTPDVTESIQMVEGSVLMEVA